MLPSDSSPRAKNSFKITPAACSRDARYFARFSRFPGEIRQLRTVRFLPSGMWRRVSLRDCIDLTGASGSSETSIHLITLRLFSRRP
jgi:hypothetical protein